MENEINHGSVKSTCEYLGIQYEKELDERMNNKSDSYPYERVPGHPVCEVDFEPAFALLRFRYRSLIFVKSNITNKKPTKL